MTGDSTSRLPVMAARGLLRRCPRCGSPPFSGFFRLEERCPGCGIRFEREEGYWVGALIVNTGVTFASFLVVFVGGMVVFWPEVPWFGLGVATIVINAVIPILFYPVSKTLWVALELSWHPLEPHELETAQRHRT